MRVLVDTCVEARAIYAEPTSVDTAIKWGTLTVPISIAAGQAKPILPKSQAWLQSQVDCFPTVAALARAEKIQLFTYSEIRLEGMKGHGNLLGALGDWFAGSHFEDIDAAIERSRIFGLSLDQMTSRQAVQEHCEWLLGSAPELILQRPKLASKFTDFEVENFKNIEVFRNICSNLSKRQLPDAFHLWTAETNGMDHFLTTDKKFIDKIRKNLTLRLKCTVVAPNELISVLGVSKLEPSPYQPGEVFDLLGRRIDKSTGDPT